MTGNDDEFVVHFRGL